MLQLGSTLGPYVVESLLAEGGMGAVYRARNRVTGQLRALKVVRPELAQKRDFVDRFVREATIASQLRHPNLVETLEPGIDGNVIYLPMELLEGETLAHHLKKKRRLTPAEAAELLVPVTHAVQALHDRGVVHRDLKPMNIFVTRAPNGALVPKVIDLGTARDVEDEEHTRTGMVVGSPFYMAPEQAEGRRDIDGRADQYALGVIAYQMITGARPYESDDTRSALAKLLRGEPFVPPSRHFPGLHAAVEAVIVKALQREREHRYARIDELGAALTAAAAGLPLPAPSPPTMITEARPMPAGASGPGAFVVPPVLGPGPSPGPVSVAPPAMAAAPLGTPGPFAPPPDATPAPAAPGRSRAPMLIGALVVLALLGVGAATIAWNMSPTMTATPLAPRSPTLAGAGTEEPVVPPVTITTTPAASPPGGEVAGTNAGTAAATGTPGATGAGPAGAGGAVPGATTGGTGAAAPGATTGGTGAAAAGTGATPSTPATPAAATAATAGGAAGTPATAGSATGGTAGGGSTAGSPTSGSRSPGSDPTTPARTGTASSGSSTGTTSTGSTGRTGSGTRGGSSGGSRDDDHERGGGASHGAPCGAATGIPCLD